MKKQSLRKVLIALLMLMFLVLIAMIVVPTLPKRDRWSPRQFTEAKLRRIEMHIVNYYGKHNAWPDTETWITQLRPSISQEKLYTLESLLMDSWGMPIQ